MRLAALALLAQTAALTPAPTPTPGPLQFQEGVTVEGATRDQLYNAALVWFAVAFRSGKDVLQVQNKDAGMLVGTGSEQYEPVVFMSSSCIRGLLRYRVMVEAKDGRYRYTIDGFTHEGGTVECRMSGISFGPLTTAPQCPGVKGVTAGGCDKTWGDLKMKATALADVLSKSLRTKLATAATEKAW